MNSDNLVLTINVVTYNHEQYIAKCLDTLLSQKTKFDFIIRIFEDCSKDRTAEICQKYADKYPTQIFFYPAEKNLGIKYNPLRSYQGIESPYYMFIEGDDYVVDDDRFQKQVDILEKHPECSFCAAKSVIYMADKDIYTHTHPDLKTGIYSLDLLKSKPNLCYYTRLGTRIVRTSCIRIEEDVQDIYLSDQGQIFLLLQQGNMYYQNSLYFIYNSTGSGLYSGCSHAFDKIALTFNFLSKTNAYFNYEMEEHFAYLLGGEINRFLPTLTTNIKQPKTLKKKMRILYHFFVPKFIRCIFGIPRDISRLFRRKKGSKCETFVFNGVRVTIQDYEKDFL